MENVFGVLRTNPVPSSSTRSSCPPSHWPPPHASQHQPLLKPILQRLHFHTLPCREVSTLLRGLTNSEAAARTYEAPLTISSPIWNVIVKGWFLVSNKKKKKIDDDKDYRRRDMEAFAMCSKVPSIVPQHITQRIPLHPSHSPVHNGLLPDSLQTGKPRPGKTKVTKA